MKEKKIYTLEDVARELGVSKTTVSRAISGKGRIGKETRERVQRFIEEHHYQPNAVARGLAQKKTCNLALILPRDYAATEFTFFKECMNGICETASRHGYDILVSVVEGEALDQIRRLVVNKKVDGIILSRAVEHSRVQEYLKERGMPFLVIGPRMEDGTLSVDNRNLEASQELTELLLIKGVQKLALLGGQRNHCVTLTRYRGVAQAHEKLGIPLNEKLVFLDVDSHQTAMQAVSRALEAGADGVLCMDDFISGLALGCLLERGVHVPGEMKVASLYDGSQLEHGSPSVTSVHFDTLQLGRNACLRLLKLLGEEAEEELPSDYQVILRESTK